MRLSLLFQELRYQIDLWKLEREKRECAEKSEELEKFSDLRRLP